MTNGKTTESSSVTTNPTSCSIVSVTLKNSYVAKQAKIAAIKRIKVSLLEKYRMSVAATIKHAPVIKRFIKFLVELVIIYLMFLPNFLIKTHVH